MLLGLRDKVFALEIAIGSEISRLLFCRDACRGFTLQPSPLPGILSKPSYETFVCFTQNGPSVTSFGRPPPWAIPCQFGGVPPIGYDLLWSLPFATPRQPPLLQFKHNEHDQSQPHGDQELIGCKRHHLEELVQEWHVNGGELKQEGPQHHH